MAPHPTAPGMEEGAPQRMTGPQRSKVPRSRLLELGYLGVGRPLCRVARTGLLGWVLFELTCQGKSTGQKGGDGGGHGDGSRATALAGWMWSTKGKRVLNVTPGCGV